MSDEFFFHQAEPQSLAQVVLPHHEQLVLQGFAEGELIRGCDITCILGAESLKTHSLVAPMGCNSAEIAELWVVSDIVWIIVRIKPGYFPVIWFM